MCYLSLVTVCSHLLCSTVSSPRRPAELAPCVQAQAEPSEVSDVLAHSQRDNTALGPSGAIRATTCSRAIANSSGLNDLPSRTSFRGVVALDQGSIPKYPFFSPPRRGAPISLRLSLLLSPPPRIQLASFLFLALSYRHCAR